MYHCQTGIKGSSARKVVGDNHGLERTAVDLGGRLPVFSLQHADTDTEERSDDQ